MVAVILTAPFLSRHLEVLRALGSGEIGPKYLLASPVGVIGLQWSLDAISPNAQILVLWLVAIGVTLHITWRTLAQHPKTVVKLVGIVALNAMAQVL